MIIKDQDLLICHFLSLVSGVEAEGRGVPRGVGRRLDVAECHARAETRATGHGRLESAS